MTFFKCHEIDGDWEKKIPSEDPRFHLRGPWVKSDNIFPVLRTADRLQTCQEVLGDIWIMTRVAK